MDDFGTGYSSLGYLQRFPIDVLKIDKSFIFDLISENTSSGNKEIVKAIIDLARNLNLEVVAEGIETGKALTYLTLNGCHFGQGYLFGRGLDSETATQLLDKQQT